MTGWCAGCYQADRFGIERFLCDRRTCTCRCMHLSAVRSRRPQRFTGIPEGHVRSRMLLSDDPADGERY